MKVTTVQTVTSAGLILVCVVVAIVLGIQMNQSRVVLEDEQRRLDEIDKRMGRTEQRFDQISTEIDSMLRRETERRDREAGGRE